MPIATLSRCVSASVSLVGVALSTSAALAATQEVAVLRSYEAPGDCPGATAFMDHFAARTQRVRITSSSTSAHLSFVVTLAHEDGQVVGKLAIRDRGGVTSHRVVSAQSCDEVVPALAFVAALAADPSAQAAPSALPNATTSQPKASAPAPNATTSPGAPPSQPGAPAASSAESASRQVPAATAVAAPAVVAPYRPQNPAQSQKLAPHGEEHEQRWRWSFAGQLGAMSGPSPKWSPLGALFVNAHVPRSVWGARGILSLGFLGALPSDKETRPGSVEFQWLTAATGICPVVIGLSDQWSAAPCVIGELGMLRGTASGISTPGARMRWWRAVGAAIQLRWAPQTRYFLQSETAITSPLARDEFGIVNEGQFDSVHKVPSIVGRVGLGVGVLL